MKKSVKEKYNSNDDDNNYFHDRNDNNDKNYDCNKK